MLYTILGFNLAELSMKQCERCGATPPAKLTKVEWVGGMGALKLAEYWLCAGCLAEAKRKDGEYR